MAIGFDQGTTMIIAIPNLAEIDYNHHEANYAQIDGVCFSLDERTLFSTNADGYKVLIWDHGFTSHPKILYEGPATDDVDIEYEAWDGFIPGVLQIDPLGKLLVCGDNSGRMKLWDAQTYQLYADFQGHHSYIRRIAFNPSGTHFVSASADGSIGFWDSSGQGVALEVPHIHDVKGVAWKPDGQSVISIGAIRGQQFTENGAWEIVHQWDPYKQILIAQYSYPSPRGQAVSFHPSGALLATSDDRSMIRLWDVHSWKPSAVVESNGQEVHHLFWTPDGQYLISGGCGLTSASFGIDVWEFGG